jgi:hypothetical protein
MNGYQFTVLLFLGAVLSLWLQVRDRVVYQFSVKKTLRSKVASRRLSDPIVLAFAKGANQNQVDTFDRPTKP